MTRQSDDTAPGAARVVVVCMLAVFIIFGIRFSFSVFFAEFVLVEGWSNEASAAIFSLNMLCLALCAPLSGIAIDRFGPRPVFGLGVCLMAAGLGLSSRATSLNDLLLTYGIIDGCGVGITGLGPVASVVAGWTTPAQRGRAIGIVFAGTGLGALAFVPLTNWLITLFDWRGAFVALSLICIFVLLPLIVFGLRQSSRAPRPTGHSPSARTAWRQLLRQPRFWALLIVGLTAMGPVRSLTVHQIAYMESAEIERTLAANVVGFAGLLTSVCFVAMGWVSDHYGRFAAFAIGAAGLLGAVGILFLLPSAGGATLLLLYAVCFALGEGTRSSQTTALASDVFHRQGLGFINGLMGGMFGLGAALVPWLVGRIRDQSGAYDGGLILVALMVVVSIGAFWYVTRARIAIIGGPA